MTTVGDFAYLFMGEGVKICERYFGAGHLERLMSKWSLPRRKAFIPVLASLLRERWVALLLVGIAVAQEGLVALGLPGWQCPVRGTLGIPCPGCGLSRAILLLLKGDWRAALSTHAFAPVFLVGFALMAVVSLLPGSLRERVIGGIEEVERRTGVVLFMLWGLVVYWMLRVLAILF